MLAPDDAETFYPRPPSSTPPGSRRTAAAGPPHHQCRGHSDGREPRPRGGERRSIAGLDFSTIHQDATLIEGHAGGPRRSPRRTRGRWRAPAAPAETPATPPPTTPAPPNPFVIGEAPEGATC